MRFCKLAFAAPVVALIATGLVAAADAEKVPLYTGEDLDRMFGPAPPGPSVLVDKSRPEDWRVVEQFIDREYARIDADRQHELNRRDMDSATSRNDGFSDYYGGSLLWGAGYGGYGGYGGWDVAGPGYGRGNHRGVQAAVCRGSGYRLGHASVATSMKRAGVTRPSHRRR